MQCSSVQFSQLNPEFRWDAEFYREEILTRLAQLQQKDHKRLGSLVGFIVGPFGSTITSDNYVLDSDYKYVRNKDIEDFFVKSDSLACIPDSIFNEHPQFHIRQDDLIFTVVGTLGKVAIARYECQKALFSCKSTLIRTKAINPYYLAAYLNSSTGRLFSCEARGALYKRG